jgi:hypothetical protein
MAAGGHVRTSQIDRRTKSTLKTSAHDQVLRSTTKRRGCRRASGGRVDRRMRHQLARGWERGKVDLFPKFVVAVFHRGLRAGNPGDELSERSRAWKLESDGPISRWVKSM